MSVHNLKKYKEARAVLPDVESIINILVLMEKVLSFYRHYIPVAKVLQIVRDQKNILEIHHKDLKVVNDSRGKRNE